ncbi:MAG TPA: histidine kinase [Chryseosolibacter sp.]|nr:histidine kinase [Chryseosolibacter sp.]
MKKYFIHHVLFRVLAPPIYGVLLYLLILLINNNVGQVDELFTNEEVYICIVLTYVSFESMRLIIVLMNRFLGDKYDSVRVPIQLLLTAALSVALVLTCLHLYFNYVLGFSPGMSQVTVFGVLYGSTAFLYNVLYFSNYYLQKENTVRLAAEKNHRDVLETEIIEFKNDINPDLLYESLENLINLIYKDVDAADEYIDSLASAYRYVLSNRQQELVPVSLELDAAKNVIRLLNEKYFGQLRFESLLSEDEMDTLLIPGTLPIIVECIARNTIVSRFEPLIIRCYLEDDYITLQSKLNDRLIEHRGTDIALQKLQKSYALYSDQPMIRVKAYEENNIKLPVIRLTEDALV